jgi:hypothetical protein
MAGSLIQEYGVREGQFGRWNCTKFAPRKGGVTQTLAIAKDVTGIEPNPISAPRRSRLATVPVTANWSAVSVRYGNPLRVQNAH